MTTNFNDILPKQILFNLRDIEAMGVMKVDTLKKFISQDKIEIVKIGAKTHISRVELVRYLTDNTIPKSA